MDDSRDYKVKINGEKAESCMREKGVYEITVPGTGEKAVITVTAVC
jgi:hypothetical protein